MINRHIDVSQSGKLWLLLAGLAVAVYIAMQLGSSIAGGSFKAAVLLGGAFAVFFVVGRITSDWRQGVYFFFGWLLFEDMLRKYLGNNMFVYFGKDLLVLITYMVFIVDRTRSEKDAFHPPFKASLSLYFLMGLVQVFNPLSPSIFYGILGLKLHFLYIPLMFVAYAMMKQEEDLRKFLVVTMGLGAVIAIVGIIQSVVGLNFLNPSNPGSDIELLGHLTRQTHFGIEVPRPPGVFVSSGRFSDYLMVVFLVGLGAAAYLQLRSARGRKIVFPAVAVIALATVLAGGRAPFMQSLGFSGVMFACILWGTPPDAISAYRLFKAIRRSFIVVALLVSLALIYFPDIIGSRLTFYQESAVPGAEYSEVGTRVWTYPMAEFQKALADRDWLMGHGTGMASLGAQYVTRIMNVAPSGVAVESGYGNLLLEFGVLGPILFLLWAFSFTFQGIRTTLKLKGTWAFPLAVSIMVFSPYLLFLTMWGTIVVYEDFVMNAYFWFLAGVLFRLPALVKQTAEQERLDLVLAHERAQQALAPVDQLA